MAIAQTPAERWSARRSRGGNIPAAADALTETETPRDVVSSNPEVRTADATPVTQKSTKRKRANKA